MSHSDCSLMFCQLLSRIFYIQEIITSYFKSVAVSSDVICDIMVIDNLPALNKCQGESRASHLTLCEPPLPADLPKKALGQSDAPLSPNAELAPPPCPGHPSSYGLSQSTTGLGL